MPKSSAKSLSSERLAAAGNALLSKTRRASTLPKIAAAQRTRSPKSRVPLSTSLSQQRLNVVKESTNQQELTSTSSSPSTDQSTTKASFLNGNLEQSSLSHRDELVKENARPSTDVPKPFVENCQIDPMLQGVNATSYRLLTRPIAGGATGATRHSNISNCNNSDSSNFAFLSSPSRASVAVSSSTSVVGVVTRANRHRAAKERQPQSGVESGRYHKRARHASELEMKASPARASVPTRSTPITVAFLKQFLGMDEEKLQQTFFFNGRDSDPVGKVPKSQHGEWQNLPIRRDCFNALNAAQGDDNKKKLGVDVVMAFCRTVIYHHNRQYPNAPAHVFGPELMRSLFEGGDTFVYDADNDRPTCLPEGKSIFDFHTLLLSMYPEELHWSLLVVSLTEETVWFFDSLGGRDKGTERLRKVKKWLEAVCLAEKKESLPITWKFIHWNQCKCIQKNEFDCGTYLCINLCGALESLLKSSNGRLPEGRFSFTFSKKDARFCRFGIAHIIATGGTDAIELADEAAFSTLSTSCHQRGFIGINNSRGASKNCRSKRTESSGGPTIDLRHRKDPPRTNSASSSTGPAAPVDTDSSQPAKAPPPPSDTLELAEQLGMATLECSRVSKLPPRKSCRGSKNDSSLYLDAHDSLFQSPENGKHAGSKRGESRSNAGYFGDVSLPDSKPPARLSQANVAPHIASAGFDLTLSDDDASCGVVVCSKQSVDHHEEVEVAPMSVKDKSLNHTHARRALAAFTGNWEAGGSGSSAGPRPVPSQTISRRLRGTRVKGPQSCEDWPLTSAIADNGGDWLQADEVGGGISVGASPDTALKSEPPSRGSTIVASDLATNRAAKRTIFENIPIGSDSVRSNKRRRRSHGLASNDDNVESSHAAVADQLDLHGNSVEYGGEESDGSYNESPDGGDTHGDPLTDHVDVGSADEDAVDQHDLHGDGAPNKEDEVYAGSQLGPEDMAAAQKELDALVARAAGKGAYPRKDGYHRGEKRINKKVSFYRNDLPTEKVALAFYAVADKRVEDMSPRTVMRFTVTAALRISEQIKAEVCNLHDRSKGTGRGATDGSSLPDSINASVGFTNEGAQVDHGNEPGQGKAAAQARLTELVEYAAGRGLCKMRNGTARSAKEINRRAVVCNYNHTSKTAALACFALADQRAKSMTDTERATCTKAGAKRISVEVGIEVSKLYSIATGK